MGFLNRLIRQEIQGASPERVAEEEAYEEMMRQQQAMGLNDMVYTGGKPLAPMAPMPLPPNIDHETMKIYLKPETPKNKHELKGDARFWIYDDSFMTTILTSNLTGDIIKKIMAIQRQAMCLQGCDNVSRLILNLQNEISLLVNSCKARSDLPDHIRERLVPSVGMSLYGEANMAKNTGERPKESRAIVGSFNWGK